MHEQATTVHLAAASDSVQTKFPHNSQEGESEETQRVPPLCGSVKSLRAAILRNFIPLLSRQAVPDTVKDKTDLSDIRSLPPNKPYDRILSREVYKPRSPQNLGRSQTRDLKTFACLTRVKIVAGVIRFFSCLRFIHLHLNATSWNLHSHGGNDKAYDSLDN